MNIAGNKTGTDNPCRNECTDLKDTPQCQSCKRTRKEIRNWGSFTDEEKRDINEDLKTRKLDDPYTISGGYADA